MRTKLVVLALVAATVPACSKAEDKKVPPKTATDRQSAANRFEIAVTENGFEPADVSVPSGKPVTIVFERKTDKTCATEVVLDLGDGKPVTKALPLDQPVEVGATFPKAGKLTYACGMDMYHGTIVVQ